MDAMIQLMQNPVCIICQPLPGLEGGKIISFDVITNFRRLVKVTEGDDGQNFKLGLVERRNLIPSLLPAIYIDYLLGRFGRLFTMARLER